MDFGVKKHYFNVYGFLLTCKSVYLTHTVSMKVRRVASLGIRVRTVGYHVNTGSQIRSSARAASVPNH